MNTPTLHLLKGIVREGHLLSSVSHTSVGTYIATTDMKPKLCFSLNRIICSSVGVTSAMNGYSLYAIMYFIPMDILI